VTKSALAVLVVDDEPLARRLLIDFLASVGYVGEVKEAADGDSAIRLIDAWQPDVVFLDIVMPGATGLDVVSRIEHHPYIVFTTAFDDYAVSAFELGALDYVLKPFGLQRLQEALERARLAYERDRHAHLERAREVLGKSETLRRVFVRDGKRIVNLDLRRVEHIEAADDYAVLHFQGARYLAKVRLHDLETRLDPAQFVRIHRSHILNVDFIMSCEVHDAWRLSAELRSGRRIVASRAGTRLLKRLVLG
jgi:two-component system, LytTR family, response regulator